MGLPLLLPAAAIVRLGGAGVRQEALSVKGPSAKRDPSLAESHVKRPGDV